MSIIAYKLPDEHFNQDDALSLDTNNFLLDDTHDDPSNRSIESFMIRIYDYRAGSVVVECAMKDLVIHTGSPPNRPIFRSNAPPIGTSQDSEEIS